MSAILVVFSLCIDPYVFDPTVIIYCRHRIGEIQTYGHIDSDGSFVPDLSSLPRNGDFDKQARGVFDLVDGIPLNSRVYEFRCHVLVPMIKDPGRGLIPVIGGDIIHLSSYRYSPSAPRIYNLPGVFVLRHGAIDSFAWPTVTRLHKPELRMAEKQPDAAPSVLASEYLYEPVAGLRVRHHVGQWPCVGTLDSKGNFIPDLTTLNSTFGSIGGPRLLIEPKIPNETVYEFRSGILIPMIIDVKGRLVPEVGGRIIDFKDYRFLPSGRRVYNLPGRFVQKK
jgi:hypothetical protein